MCNKINGYVDGLFEYEPKSKENYYLKQELVLNATNKYNSLLELGMGEEEAYEKSIVSIGPVDELIKNNRDYLREEEEYRKKSGIRVSIAVMLYIICPIPIILLSDRGYKLVLIGVVLLLSIVALSTGILIYNGYDKPVIKNIDYELYDEFLTWKENNKKEIKLVDKIGNVAWLLIVAIYFTVSFTYNNWHVSWVIFILGGVIKNAIDVFFIYNEKK